MNWHCELDVRGSEQERAMYVDPVLHLRTNAGYLSNKQKTSQEKEDI
jgi:hypothetical protein